MRKGEHRGRKMKEAEAGRGRARSKGREGVLEGGKEEVGREIRARQAGEQEGEEGGKDGREGDTNAQCQAWLCTEACQWLLAFTLY